MDALEVGHRNPGRFQLDHLQPGPAHATQNCGNSLRVLRVPGARIVLESRRVGRYNHLHALTLPHMTSQLDVRGSWPGPVSFTRGWARCEARRWNDEFDFGHLRLVRGGLDFLESATEMVAKMSGGVVYSPALYPSSTRIWRRAGFETGDHLDVMELPAGRRIAPPKQALFPVDSPDLDRLLEVDYSAFEPFWRMGHEGLEEAFHATPVAAVFMADEHGEPSGYTIVGVQAGAGFIQRLAVKEKFQGHGIGGDLLRAGVSWCRSRGARNIVLNVRESSTRAIGLYRSEGFANTGVQLEILHKAPARVGI